MRNVILLLFLLTTYFIFRPIIGDVWYSVHDTTSVARAFLLEKTLTAGQIPAIWSAELNNGAGYPLFHFYAPAFTYLSLLTKAVSGSYFVGIKLMLGLSTVLGMIGMYLLTRKWGRAAGLVAAFSYALLPYAAVNLYVRGAYAEYLAMGLLPWVFYAWSDIKGSRKQMFAGITTALFLLSHNLIPLITAPFLLVWIYLNRPAKLKLLILPTLITLGLSAFYLIPLIFERGFVQADVVAVTTDYSKHFVAPSQLWNSLWGYGGSDVGVEDGMSFKVGKIQLILATIASLLIVKRKKSWFFPVALAVTAFMTTTYSSFVWSNLPSLPIVQFPWRFLVLVGFFAAVLAGYSLTIVKSHVVKAIISLTVITMLFILNLKLFTPQTIYPTNLTTYTSKEYLDTIPSIVPEYNPAWVGRGNPVRQNSTTLTHYYYPTWKVILDGQPVETYPSPDGYLSFQNPTNSTNFTATQSHTNLEYLAATISLITLLYVIKYYVKK